VFAGTPAEEDADAKAFFVRAHRVAGLPVCDASS
jgi:hypothetical protein